MLRNVLFARLPIIIKTSNMKANSKRMEPKAVIVGKHMFADLVFFDCLFVCLFVFTNN